MISHRWTDQDLKQMNLLGIAPAEASHQLELFENPPPFVFLDRPAKVGDGISRLTMSRKRTALKKYDAARRKGRFSKFVPASGAASRMFHLLTKFLQREPFSVEDLREEILKGEEESRQFLEFMESITRTAFSGELGKVLARKNLDLDVLRREGRFKEILEALLLPGGLNYSQRPKGLVKFHSYPAGERTPIEEHLVEAVEVVKDGEKRCRIHFTVSEEHEETCRGHFMEIREKYEKQFGVKFDIRFSTQFSHTNTLAVDGENHPFRDEDGRLVFRPSGHGALLENLNGLRGDLVYIKNIDNVAPEHLSGTTVHWKKILGGHLIILQDKIFEALKKVSGKKVRPKVVSETANFSRKELNLDLGEDFTRLPAEGRARRLKNLLNRPLRVCGMVPNKGEPGGGPFWVKGKEGRNSLQIVESAQVDLARKDQKTLFEKSTHFNPVDLVCGVRDWKGKPFDLRRFRDPGAIFISRKSVNGKDLKALEVPGLWNGAMAGWISLFVEVPLETFNPVKTVFDLLKPAHQAKV